MNCVDDGSLSKWIENDSLDEKINEEIKLQTKSIHECIYEERNSLIASYCFYDNNGMKNIQKLSYNNRILIFLSGFWVNEKNEEKNEIKRFMKKTIIDKSKFYFIFISNITKAEDDYTLISHQEFNEFIFKNNYKSIEQKLNSISENFKKKDFDYKSKINGLYEEYQFIEEIKSNCHIKDSEKLFIYYLMNYSFKNLNEENYVKITFIISSLNDTCPFCLSYYRNRDLEHFFTKGVGYENNVMSVQFIISFFKQYYEDKTNINSLTFFNDNINHKDKIDLLKEFILKIKAPQYSYLEKINIRKTMEMKLIPLSYFKSYFDQILISLNKKDVEEPKKIESKVWRILGGKNELEIGKEELDEQNILRMFNIQPNEFGGFFRDKENTKKVGISVMKENPGIFYIQFKDPIHGSILNTQDISIK